MADGFSIVVPGYFESYKEAVRQRVGWGLVSELFHLFNKSLTATTLSYKHSIHGGQSQVGHCFIFISGPSTVGVTRDDSGVLWVSSLILCKSVVRQWMGGGSVSELPNTPNKSLTLITLDHNPYTHAGRSQVGHHLLLSWPKYQVL